MTERHLLKIGPRAPFETRGVCWVALADRDDHVQLSGDFLVTKECLSLRELEAEITQMKQELDQILHEAQKRFVL
jgi:hypothetical protein